MIQVSFSLISWLYFSHLCTGIPSSILAPTASYRRVSGGRCLLRQQTWGNRFQFPSIPIPVLEDPTYVGPEGIPRVLGAEGALVTLPGKCQIGGGCSPQNRAGPDQSPSSSLLWDGASSWDTRGQCLPGWRALPASCLSSGDCPNRELYNLNLDEIGCLWVGMAIGSLKNLGLMPRRTSGKNSSCVRRGSLEGLLWPIFNFQFVYKAQASCSVVGGGLELLTLWPPLKFIDHYKNKS